MKIATISLIFFLVAVSIFFSYQKFAPKSSENDRVKQAYQEKGNLIDKELKTKNLERSNFHLLIIAYKLEKELELWVKHKAQAKYEKLSMYAICATSGTLGPKKMQGDRQIPEGLYHINRFNPKSQYFLSLGLNYPNQADKMRSNAKDLGGDIFIHGDCVTIGCMPMTDDKIKEIYIYALEAQKNGQKNIPVYVFPFRFSEKNKGFFFKKFENEEEKISLWKNLQEAWNIFEKNKTELPVNVDPKGNYTF
jgi:murein L,D-transpeptidase YafK